MIDNKEVKYLGAEESYKKGAEWLSSLYSEGLIDRDAFTQDDSSLAQKFLKEPLACSLPGTDLRLVSMQTIM